MKIDVKVDLNDIKKEIKELSTNQKVLLFAANTARTYMDKYVPRESGDLRDTSIVYLELEKAIVEYVQLYAHYQYIGSPIPGQRWNYTTALTGPYWDKAMMQNDREKLIKSIQNFIDTQL